MNTARPGGSGKGGDVITYLVYGEMKELTAANFRRLIFFLLSEARGSAHDSSDRQEMLTVRK